MLKLYSIVIKLNLFNIQHSFTSKYSKSYHRIIHHMNRNPFFSLCVFTVCLFQHLLIKLKHMALIRIPTTPTTYDHRHSPVVCPSAHCTHATTVSGVSHAGFLHNRLTLVPLPNPRRYLMPVWSCVMTVWDSGRPSGRLRSACQLVQLHCLSSASPPRPSMLDHPKLA